MACLRQIFDKPPLPTRGTLIESLSWNQLRPAEPTFEMFGEIQFREKPQRSAGSPSSSMPCGSEDADGREGSADVGAPRRSGSPGGRPENERRMSGGLISLADSEPLQLCTEGLGSETVDIDHADDTAAINGSPRNSRAGKEEGARANAGSRLGRSYSDVRPGSNGRFPPPITSIGAGGKPWIYFKSFREDGRFVLKKTSIPTQQCLRATRGNGRLVLHSAHPCEATRLQGGDGDHDGKEEEAGDEEKRERRQNSSWQFGLPTVSSPC